MSTRPGRSAVLPPATLAAAAAMAVIAWWSTPAQAYPQWQLASGATRCNQCHYAPAGGGLVNAYARDAAGDELSTFPGDGALLHGALSLPGWLALGGDFRGAFVSTDVQNPDGATTAFFPMQADLYARVSFGYGISFYGSGGLRGQVRDNDEIMPMQSFQPVTASRLISREHWLIWQPAALGPYVRAGRYYAPFGLRMAEHIMYVRRDMGFGMLQETYNVSGGFVSDQAELHVTAFAPDFVRHIGSEEKGVAAYYERRGFGDRLALAAQARIADGPGATRFMLGAVAKAYAEPIKCLFFAELNGVEVSIDDDRVGTRDQLVGAAGVTALPLRGLMFTLLGERFQEDVRVRDAAWTAATALLSWFPYPHVEAQIVGRVQWPAGGEAARAVLAQLHYFL